MTGSHYEAPDSVLSRTYPLSDGKIQEHSFHNILSAITVFSSMFAQRLQRERK
jgi:hypothetical protein